MGRILTDGEHELITDDPDLEQRAEDQRRIRAQRHIREAIIELSDIREHLSSDEFKQLFTPGPRADVTAEELERGARDMVRFAYLGLKTANRVEEVKEELANEIEQAERQLAAERGELFEDIDNLDALVDRYKAGQDGYSSGEVSALLEASQMRYRGLGRSDREPSLPTFWIEAKSQNREQSG